jgi:cytochrome c biogenesis protein CcdA
MVFSLVGLIVFIVGAFINPYLKMLQIVAAVIIIGFGVILLMRVTVPRLSLTISPPKRRGYLGLFLYGIAYGMAALACSSPIFLSIILYALRSGGSIQALVTFLVYALGMGTPLIAITYLVATMKQLLINRIRSALAIIQRFSGILLIIMGILLIADYYDYIHLL